jgi:ABC-type proline/glycine betaine transport system permease subunit
MGPRSTWYVAVAAIVIGHAVSIWLAHRIALRELAEPRLAALACVPLTFVMLIYTATSLAIIAEPMVKFETPELPAS